MSRQNGKGSLRDSIRGWFYGEYHAESKPGKKLRRVRIRFSFAEVGVLALLMLWISQQ